ncbi:hypothetical protein [Hyphomonas sp.]|uniref:hypothetical protein n=1 Tax=Hyphomonas sp. TaxID=87 RepID=UPI000C3E3461|nr:hypothetical protein [Hyphomonas sp.]MAB11540.1 hypothetical protein [Hyphomonas sp.]MAU66996.1 hypothetical protein [Hyphomonas sp.]MBM57257.1 hypothetical protein [Hyphomonas sp.]
MELLHKGFDALDLAYAVHFPTKYMPKLNAAKQRAMEIGQPVPVWFGDVGFNVASTGARGGYAFRCDTGSAGEIWFLKKPSTNDPWGVRISVSAVQCALVGLAGVKRRIEEKFEKLGVAFRDGQESISRVDFALDFIIPNFTLVADNFVMHPRATRMAHVDISEYKSGGRSGRTESVTVGKNPGRQIIIYDKRAEVLNKGNSHWPVVWNKSREKLGLPPIDLQDRDASQIWRVELRAYKRHLKDDWDVATWWQLQEKLPNILNSLITDIRYTAPSLDMNRSRWPDHPLWTRVRTELQGGLSEMKSFATESAIKERLHAEHDDMLKAMIAGSLIALAAHRNTELANLPAFTRNAAEEFITMFRDHPAKTERKLAQSKGKYS